MIKNSLFLLVFMLLLAGCGYKPSIHYAKEQIGHNVFVDMYVSIEDPKNSVIIKDAMLSLLANKFNAKLVSNKAEADTLFKLRLNSVSMQVLQYDDQGFEKLYRANISILVEYSTGNNKKVITVSGIDDFSVDGEGEISEAKRFEAIRNASSRALEEVLSKIAIESFRKPKEEKSNL